MSDAVTVSVEVSIAPAAAFEVFTRDIDAWYRVDAAALPDITRTAAIRFEPHVGGRLLDVHDLASGAGRELGRITAWEPGHRLVFVDNGGSEIEVVFEAHDGGTRVMLTHRGLDRLAPTSGDQEHSSGWANLATLYRDHLAPNAKPLAFALATLALVFVVSTGGLALTVGWPEPGEPVLSPGSTDVLMFSLVFIAGVAAMIGFFKLVVTRRLASRWRFVRMYSLVLGLLSAALLIHGVYLLTQGSNGLGLIPLAVLGLVICWRLIQAGPAAGRSLRVSAQPRREAALDTWARRHPRLWRGALLAAVVAFVATFSLLPLHLLSIFAPIFASLVLVGSLRAIFLQRRKKRALGFHPGFYVSVAREVSDHDRRPQLLIRRASELPEFSGWHAYADPQDQGSADLVTWTTNDLLDHAPEAAHPLRQGHGTWIWNPSQRAYTRIEDPSRQPQPA